MINFLPPEAYVLSSSLLLFSRRVMSGSLRPHGLQHTRPPCLSPWACPSSRSWHRHCHPVISSSNALFSFCPQSCPAPGTFPRSHVCIRWPQYWSFSSSPSSKYSVLSALGIDWFDLPVQETVSAYNFLNSISGGQRSLIRYSPWGQKEVDTT